MDRLPFFRAFQIVIDWSAAVRRARRDDSRREAGESFPRAPRATVQIKIDETIIVGEARYQGNKPRVK